MSKEEKAEQARDLYTRQFIARIEALMEDFVEEFQVNENLTSLDRRRLTGAGVRNNGFMDKAFDIMVDNPQFAPPNFDLALLRWNMREMEDFRQLFIVQIKKSSRQGAKNAKNAEGGAWFENCA
jgi:hypothetical protein